MKSTWVHLALRVHNRVQLFATPWTVALQAPLSMGFSRLESWSGLPFPPPGGLSDPGLEPTSLVSPALAGGFFTTMPHRKPWEHLKFTQCYMSNILFKKKNFLRLLDLYTTLNLCTQLSICLWPSSLHTDCDEISFWASHLNLPTVHPKV